MARLHHFIGQAVAVVMLCSGAAQAAPSAQPSGNAVVRQGDVPDARKGRRRVAILPIRDNMVEQARLFDTGPARRRAAKVVAIDKHIAAALSADPYMDILAPAAVRRKLSGDHSLNTASRLANQWYRIGLAHWMSMSPRRAAETFKKAVALYRQVYQDISEPKSYADAAFMHGVALVDAGDTIAGHVALKEAFALQPARRFRPRFFAPDIERSLQTALADYLQSGNQRRPYGDSARMAALADRLDAEAIVIAAVVPDEKGGGELSVAVFSARRRTFEAETRFPLDRVDQALEPFLSRWRACLPVVEVRPTGNPNSKFVNLWMDTSASYAQYMRHKPTRRAFHSLGFAAGVSQSVGPGLEWFARFNLFTSLSDPWQDLAHPFNSVRVVGGVGFAYKRGWLRLFARPGLEAHVLGSFVATHDPWCKKTQNQPNCVGPIYNLEQDVLFGVNLALGTQMHVGARFFVALGGSISTYFLPFAGTDQLNYPISGELGMGYRF